MICEENLPNNIELIRSYYGMCNNKQSLFIECRYINNEILKYENENENIYKREFQKSKLSSKYKIGKLYICMDADKYFLKVELFEL